MLSPWDGPFSEDEKAFRVAYINDVTHAVGAGHLIEPFILEKALQMKPQVGWKIFCC